MSNSYIKIVTVAAFLLSFGLTVFLHAADMDERIHHATRILESIQRSGHPISQNLLQHAKGVAIFDATKAGIGIGGQGGEGIVVAKENDSWRAPSAFDVRGGSIGAQLGYSETRYIVLLMTDDALRHFTYPTGANWNATASSTIGSDTKTARAATNDPRRDSIIVYKSSGGAFGGATLGGTGIDLRNDVNRHFYGRNVGMSDILSGRVHPPKSARYLYRLLNG